MKFELLANISERMGRSLSLADGAGKEEACLMLTGEGETAPVSSHSTLCYNLSRGVVGKAVFISGE